MFSQLGLRLAKRCIFGTRSVAMSTVAVVLSGNGVYDGSEIHEASAVLVNLHRYGAEFKVYAPDKAQMHTINHCNGNEMDEKRNVLVESARIARGEISPLSDLLNSELEKDHDHDAIIFPGGFGVAKNLSTFSTKGTDMEVDPDVEKVIKKFHQAKKPIGLCCFAPVLAAKVIPNCEVTMGEDTEQDGKYPYAGAARGVAALGGLHVNKSINEIHIDVANQVVTTPAFMCNAKLHEVHDGVAAMVKAVIDLSESK